MSEQVTQTPTTPETTSTAAVSEQSKAAEAPKPQEGILSGGGEEAAKGSESSAKVDDEKAEPPTSANTEVKYDLKLPEGSSLGKEHVDSVLELAKAKNLTPEQAQLVLEQKSEAVASFAKLQKQQVDLQSDKWLESIKTDKELGGDNFNKVATLSREWAKKNLPAELIDLIVESGAQNFPPLIKWMYQRASMEGNDSFVHGGKPGTVEKKPAWANMYGETTPSE